MNRYRKLKLKHQKEFESLPIVYAFGEEQFNKAMKKLGLEPSDIDKVCSLFGCGDILLKKDVPLYHEMSNRHRRELEEAIAEDKSGTEFIFDMFVSALEDHEYFYTGDAEDALRSLGISLTRIQKDKRLRRGFELACRHQMNPN